jgi:hypothetical protein
LIKKSSGLVTLGGIIGGIGLGLFGIPVATLTYYAQVVKDGPPHWFNECIFPMILAGAVFAMVGNVIVGVASKGADEHSTPAQIQAADLQAKVEQVALDADAAATPKVPTKVIVEPPTKP